jgi:hypothetical protein
MDHRVSALRAGPVMTEKKGISPGYCVLTCRNAKIPRHCFT